MVNIIKIPAINGLGKTNGTELAPDKISSEGKLLELDSDNIEDQEKEIYNVAKETIGKTIFIGGDHSISYPILKAYSEKIQHLKLIILDAHPDLMPPMENPTHEEWLSALIESGFSEKNILLIGARNIDPKEEKYLINMIEIKDLPTSSEKIREFARDSKIYLSIDIDFFDREVAPATGYPESNGAKKEEGLKLIRDIVELSNITSADIVEVNPTKNGAEKTIKLAKEILEILKNGK